MRARRENSHEDAASRVSDRSRCHFADSGTRRCIGSVDAELAFWGSSLRLRGPTSNKLGAAFEYTISGAAVSPANYVVAWEQFYPQSGCANTYAAESTRVFLPNTYGLTLFENKSVSHNYSIVEQFGADHVGKHGICAYLIDLATGDTYAYAGAFWTNHK